MTIENAHVKLQELMQRLLDYGMQAYFLLLLALARSRSHLKELHDGLVPENCRLLRDDFIVLEKAWGLRFSHDADPELDYALDHNHAGWMLAYAREDSSPSVPHRRRVQLADLTHYYCELVVKLGQPLALSRTTGFLQVYPHPNAGHKPHFMAGFCDKDVPCEIMRQVVSGTVVVCFNLWERDLTEPLTYKLMQLPAWKYEGITATDDKGRLLDINYVIDGDETLSRSVEEALRHPLDNAAVLIASQVFLDQLKSRLNDLGVPVDYIVPVPGFNTELMGDWLNWNDWERTMFVAAFNDGAPRRIKGLATQLNEAGMTTLHLAVRKGLAPDLGAKLVRQYFEERNPRLQPEDFALDQMRPSTRDDLALMPIALYFVSEEGVCLGAPHPAIPRDKRGKLLWAKPDSE